MVRKDKLEPFSLWPQRSFVSFTFTTIKWLLSGKKRSEGRQTWNKHTLFFALTVAT